MLITITCVLVIIVCVIYIVKAIGSIDRSVYGLNVDDTDEACPPDRWGHGPKS
jgi:uncharacterized protein YxeA